MYKNKEYFIIVISCLVSLILMNNYFDVQAICKINTNLLLAEIPNEEIYLYALDSAEGSGAYHNILLDVKGNQKQFNWIVDSGLSFRPQLILSDINNDNKNELVIIITTGEGTGINTQEVYIFNIETLEEIKVQNPIDIISKHISTKVYKADCFVKIYININGKESWINSNRLNAIYNELTDKKYFYDTLFFRDLIIYKVDNNKLTVSVGGDIFLWNYIALINIEYKYENNMLVVDTINFEVTEHFND